MSYSTHELAKQIVAAINKKKVLDLKVLDVQGLTPLTEMFIIAVASNVRQTKAIADEVEEVVQEFAEKSPIHKEGYQTAQWILLDYGEVIVHILDEEDAAFYALDRLWKDAEHIDFQEVVSV
ncbi:ribosome silencing factor [Cellulosilyticum ruminicola]|uniref:ribosome silencing factor n=1 Tax=Cellulosilyticum ruminicola TaxID=425254 RepID=UPI0006D1D537|nr:ribosome silencing factor [Cellulosilyticum ruminicola]